MKALLRAWLRACAAGLRFHMRHRWLGWPEDAAAAPRICVSIRPRASVAPRPMPSCWPGGGSWARLGSDGAWAPGLRAWRCRGAVAANCGFDVDWSEHFREPRASRSLVSMRCGDDAKARQGEFVVAAASRAAWSMRCRRRCAIAQPMVARPRCWICCQTGRRKVMAAVTHPRGSRSLSSHLQSRLGLTGEGGLAARMRGEQARARSRPCWACASRRCRCRCSARVRSTRRSARRGRELRWLTPGLMPRAMPGVFCVGEMLDWEARTGGYLLTPAWRAGWRWRMAWRPTWARHAGLRLQELVRMDGRRRARARSRPPGRPRVARRPGPGCR